MSRARSDDRRGAILAAATRLIASDGLGAATAAIAKEAGVSNGSLFTYFETKADLLNELYVELKAESAAATMEGLPTGNDVREQLRHAHSSWLHWAASCPEKRRALAHLGVSDDVTAESRGTARKAMAGMAELLDRSRKSGVLRDAPLGVVAAMMTALAETTIDFMIAEPGDADSHCATGFEAMWRMLA